MVEPLRHRQTKGAETDMFSLQPPRHISTLPLATVGPKKAACRDGPKAAVSGCSKTGRRGKLIRSLGRQWRGPRGFCGRAVQIAVLSDEVAFSTRSGRLLVLLQLERERDIEGSEDDCIPGDHPDEAQCASARLRHHDDAEGDRQHAV